MIIILVLPIVSYVKNLNYFFVGKSQIKYIEKCTQKITSQQRNLFVNVFMQIFAFLDQNFFSYF